MSLETGVQATYFDGRSAAVRTVTLVVAARRVVVTGSGVDRDDPIEAVEIPSALGSTLRLVRFPDGALCEVADGARFAEMLATDGLAAAAISSWERSGTLALGSIVLVVLLGIVAYLYGLPVLAKVVADRLPVSALDVISSHTLNALDGKVLNPTALSTSRVSGIVAAFERMRWPAAHTWPRRVHFRASQAFGANAFALPAGDIVVTDALVMLAADDREILAVLAHEAGHVDGRHVMRNMFQASALTLLVTWYVGDVSAIAVAAPTALLQARYSRAFERDADDYAVNALRLNGIPSQYLADILSRMEATRGATGPALGGALDYLSTHPTTAQRLARFRQEEVGK